MKKSHDVDSFLSMAALNSFDILFCCVCVCVCNTGSMLTTVTYVRHKGSKANREGHTHRQCKVSSRVFWLKIGINMMPILG